MIMPSSDDEKNKREIFDDFNFFIWDDADNYGTDVGHSMRAVSFWKDNTPYHHSSETLPEVLINNQNKNFIEELLRTQGITCVKCRGRERVTERRVEKVSQGDIL